MLRRASVALAWILALAGCGEQAPTASEATAPAQPSSSAPDTAATFDAAVAELTQGYFQVVPEAATYYGAPDSIAPGADARLNDRSVAGEKARIEQVSRLIEALKATPAELLDGERRRVRATLINLIEGALAPARVVDYGTSLDVYGVWYLPYVINQNSGPTVSVPNLMGAQQSVGSAEDASQYLQRLQALPGMLDGTLAKLRYDVELGAIPPDFIVHKAKAVVDAFAGADAKDNVLYASFATRLKAANIDGADEYAAKALALVGDGVLPAYRRIGDYLAKIAPRAPHDAGVWRLPNGEALYKAMIRHMTDSDLDAASVHRIGLDEVARISAAMDVLLRAQGYTDGSVGERMTALAAEPRFIQPNTADGKAAIMASIQSQLAGVRSVLPQLFGNLPKHAMEVRAVPEFSQDSAPSGYYDAPAPDGSRPGIYWINLRDTAIWPSFKVPTLTYHEAIPGHHMQVAIVIDQKAPFIANSFFSNSTGEGWALYAEALAAEMGLYADDPFGDLGRLQDELHRAVRLVVDTGMHAMKWSREQAIDYVVATEGADPSGAESEVERYVVWPGQALGYKIGMLKIQELRRDAQSALGDEFDIRQFHDRLLSVSSSALPVMEEQMRAWIDERGRAQ